MSDEMRDLFENVVIRASAGTGKTFALSNRFLRLLASGVHCETILATTFTRKGAGEILDRIVRRLAAAAVREEAAVQLSGELDWPGLDRPRSQQLLRDLMKNLHRLQISTLDAFFYRIAQAFELELGLPTDWQIVEELQMQGMQNRVIQDVLRQDEVVNLLHMLTQGEADRRIAQLIRLTVEQLYQIYLETTREAWDRLPEPAAFNPNRNFDAVCELLRSIDYPDKRQRRKIEDEIQLIQAQDWLGLAQSTLFAKIAAGQNSYYRALPEACIAAYADLIRHCRDFLISGLINKNRCTYDLLHQFGQRFEDNKTVTGQLRFDDITRHLEDFIAGKDTSGFSYRLDHKVDHLLLDEFQDTSIPQWRVIAPFAQRTTEDDVKKSFFCVGDLKQAIFGWRGGVAEIFDEVESELANMSEAQPLTKSYRSSPVVIETVNQVFGHLEKYKPPSQEIAQQAVGQWAARFEHHQTARHELPGYCALEYANESEDRKPSSRNDNVLQMTVDRVGEMYRAAPDHTIGILVRTNEAVGRLIFMLQEAGIAASEEGGNPLTDSAAVEMILSAISLADHPGDSAARFHLSHGPLANRLGLEPEVQDNQPANRVAAIASAAEIRRQLSETGYGPTCEHFARIFSGDCTRRELTRLQQLVQEAFNYDGSQHEAIHKLRPSRFVNHIRHEYRASDQSAARVRVMTVHQSKGLEFDIVFLPMLFSSGGWFGQQDPVIVGRAGPTEPINLVCRLTNEHHRALLPDEFQAAFDETRRREVYDNLCVLYVSMTRAIHATHVILSFSCKPENLSGAGVLLSTLVPDWKRDMREEGLVYEHGQQDWYRQYDFPPSPKDDLQLQSFYLPVGARIADPAFKTGSKWPRGIERVSPSGLEGGESVSVGKIFSSDSSSQQLKRGTLIHACFEQIQWLDDERPGRKQLMERLQLLAIEQEECEQAMAAFEQMIGSAEIGRLLSGQDFLRHFRPELITGASTNPPEWNLQVANERKFAIRLDGRMMQGTIDRLVLIYDGEDLLAADIVDYKTDQLAEPEALQARTRFYQPQLLAYRQAVAALFRLPAERVAARLAFLETGTVIRVDALASPESTLESTTSLHETRSARVEKPKFGRKSQLKLWSED